MLDLLYDLSPDEDISLVGGHLLVVITDDSLVSTAVEDYMERRISRLDDSSEFVLAIRQASLFPQLQQRAQEIPALFHFLDGKSRAVCHGVDDCVEFFEEFVIANRCKRNNVKRY